MALVATVHDEIRPNFYSVESLYGPNPIVKKNEISISTENTNKENSKNVDFLHGLGDGTVKTRRTGSTYVFSMLFSNSIFLSVWCMRLKKHCDGQQKLHATFC